MHDRKATYTIVYDAADPDLSDRDHTYGTTLLMADWLAIRNDPAMVGMSEPVLVEQFFANSWERAMQHWNDLRGYGTYYMRCEGEHNSDLTRHVLWVNDDYLCLPCVIKGQVTKALEPCVGLLADYMVRQNIKQRVTVILLEQQKKGIIHNYTVSSEVDANGTPVVRAFFTDAEGRKIEMTIPV